MRTVLRYSSRTEGFPEIRYTGAPPGRQGIHGSPHKLGARRGPAHSGRSCAEWAFVDWACPTLGIVVVPIYRRYPDQSQFIIRFGSSGWSAARPSSEPGRRLDESNGSSFQARQTTSDLDEGEWQRNADHRRRTSRDHLHKRSGQSRR
jgi:hypothetical protein